MHRFHTSLLAASTMTGLSLCAPTAQGVEVTYRTTFANGTSAKHVVLEPFDSHFVRTVYGQGHSKRAYNTFPGWGDSDEELDRIDKIREAQRDGIELAIAARDNIDTGVAYEDYFGPDDKDKVRQVYDNIIGSNTDGSGSDLLGDVQWDPSDYNNRCTPLGQEADVESVTVAYEGTSNVDGQIRALNHMCDQAYNFKAIRDISCDSLSTTVSTLMNVLGKVMVHEWTHFPPISAPVAEDGT